MYNEVKNKLIKAQIKELVDAKLVEFFNKKYALAIVMPSKKDSFNNWIEKQMCGNYMPINKKIKLDKYTIPIFKEIFNTIRPTKIFNTLDLRFEYHQLLLRIGDRCKIIFSRIDKFS